ncbi:MAG: hypothetical protein CSB48_05570 [Proteobacteria bacterium]|nr:MAG: hypothetical protein CSB48_05570 [Pseudomonadota bacterium]
MKIQPHLLAGQNGGLYVLKRFPDDVPLTKMVIFVPPFAEEANKSRHMFSLLASSLVAEGVGSILFDYYGTGESLGDFEQGSLSSYTQDLVDVVHSTATSGVPVCLVCLRLGALVALNAASRLAGVGDVVFINPVTNGRQLINQFFRLRIAGGLSSGEGKVTSKAIKAELEQAGCTEIAGYTISKTLVDELEACSLEKLVSTAGFSFPSVHLLELNGTIKKELTPVAKKAADQLAAAGVGVHSDTVAGDQFWATQEISTAPEAINVIVNILSQSGQA